MNMQNKLYTIQFSHHLMTELQPVPELRPWNPELADFAEKFQLPKKEAERRYFCLWATCIYKLSMMSMVWSISIGQLGLAV